MNGNGIWGLKWQRQDLREVCPKSLRIKGNSLSNQNHWLEKKKKAVYFSLSILRARKSNTVSCITLGLLQNAVVSLLCGTEGTSTV